MPDYGGLHGAPRLSRPGAGLCPGQNDGRVKVLLAFQDQVRHGHPAAAAAAGLFGVGLLWPSMISVLLHGG